VQNVGSGPKGHATVREMKKICNCGKYAFSRGRSKRPGEDIALKILC